MQKPNNIVDETLPIIEIEYIRPGKGSSIYRNRLIKLTDTLLKTSRVLDDHDAVRMTNIMNEVGWVQPGRTVASLTSYFFFNQWFDIVIWYDQFNELIGVYSDITTPIRLDPDGYRVEDLFLDVWISPDGSLTELDWDEFEEAIPTGVMTTEQIAGARRAMAKIVAEIADKTFPFAYIEETNFSW